MRMTRFGRYSVKESDGANIRDVGIHPAPPELTYGDDDVCFLLSTNKTTHLRVGIWIKAS